MRQISTPLSLALMVAAACLLGGCVGAPTQARHPADARMDAWASARGGWSGDARCEARVDAATARLAAVSPIDLNLKVRVVEGDAPAAFAWRGGGIALSQGLVTRFRQSEVAAVIAHEMGHLIAEQAPQYAMVRSGLKRNDDPFALAGAGESGQLDEIVADHLAVDLLSRAGYTREALASALRRLVTEPSPGLSMDRRRLLAERVALLPGGSGWQIGRYAGRGWRGEACGVTPR